jgi:type IV pilus assembly protein PilW
MNKKRQKRFTDQGFTLVELLVAMAISGVVMAGIYSAYYSQQKSYVTQEQVSAMQQNLRAAMYYMEREIRLAGYDPARSGGFGITDIRLKDIDDNLDVDGDSSLEFTIDRDEDGVVGAGDETVYYCMYDSPVAAPDGKTDLARRYGAGGRQLLAENIEALGFAYAFDNNGDGQLDTTAAGNTIWAIDSDNDNDLDVNLDTNDDGIIDINDNVAGTALANNVNISAIRSINIWLLARTDIEDRGFQDTGTYVVANKRITPNDGLRRRLLTTNIKCRNMGL